jgi:hypothetical protein
MNTKSVFLCSLALAVYALAPCAAQQLPVAPTPFGEAPPAAKESAASTLGNESGDLLPSNWIRYSQPECCNSIGCNGPIKSELYFRTGAAFPIGGGDLPRRLNSAGYVLEGGGRLLFFNPARTGAWTWDLGMSFFSDASDSADTIPLDILVNEAAAGAPANPVRRDIDVTIRHVYRTSADLALGREFYLWAPADQPGNKWRVGFDVGGRVGVVKADFNEIEHRTDNLWGAFVAVHSDWEIPCGSCVWIAGVRAEYSYTWTSILQFQNNADIGDMSVLLNFGVRF